jgi:hypothetical protein
VRRPGDGPLGGPGSPATTGGIRRPGSPEGTGAVRRPGEGPLGGPGSPATTGGIRRPGSPESSGAVRRPGDGPYGSPESTGALRRPVDGPLGGPGSPAAPRQRLRGGTRSPETSGPIPAGAVDAQVGGAPPPAAHAAGVRPAVAPDRLRATGSAAVRPAAGSGVAHDGPVPPDRTASTAEAAGPDGRGRATIATIVVTILVMLGGVPLYFAASAATRDPVFGALDTLRVPAAAARNVTDREDGSSWCITECRFRERSARSEQSVEETTRTYTSALAIQGWRSWAPTMCPDQPVDGNYTCWRRDELTLDLWIRPPACVNPKAPTADPNAGVAPTQSPAPTLSPGADPNKTCGGADVSIKVRNAIGDPRTKPQPTVDPSLIGETPDAVFTDDPLKEPATVPS